MTMLFTLKSLSLMVTHFYLPSGLYTCCLVRRYSNSNRCPLCHFCFQHSYFSRSYPGEYFEAALNPRRILSGSRQPPRENANLHWLNGKNLFHSQLQSLQNDLHQYYWEKIREPHSNKKFREVLEQNKTRSKFTQVWSVSAKAYRIPTNIHIFVFLPIRRSVVNTSSFQ